MTELKTNCHLLKSNSHNYFIYLLNNILYLEIIKDTKHELITISNNILNFSADLDISGILHIACLDTYGNLIHFTNKYNSFEKRIVNNLNIKSHKFTGLKLYINENSTHIFLAIANRFQDKQWNIIHYLITNNYWRSNEIAKIYTDRYLPAYKSDIDKYGNIHLIYKSMDRNKNKLFYRMYSNRYKKWSFARRISNENDDVTNTNILCATNGFLHVVYSVIYNKNIETIYLKKKTENCIEQHWMKVKDFPNKTSNLIHPFLIQYNNIIKVLWKQNEDFYFTQSDISKNSWEEIKPIIINKNEWFPIVYIDHLSNDSEKIKAPLTYCCYIGKKIFIVGIDDPNQYNFNSKLVSIEETLISPKIIKPESTKSKIQGFSDYLKNIEVYFKDSSIVFDLIPEIKVMAKENKVDLSNEENLGMQDIIKKLTFLHHELSELKNNELIMLNSFLDIKNDYLELYKKIEDLLMDFNNLKEQKNTNKNRKSFDKIIEMFNDNTFSNSKQKYKG